MTRTTHMGAKALVIGSLLVALGGCAAGQPATSGDEAAGDDAATEQAAQSQTFEGGSMSWEGKELTVELEANPSTGYDWDVMITGDGLEFSGRSEANATTASDDTAATDAATATDATTATDGAESAEGAEGAASTEGAENPAEVGTPVIETFTFTGKAKGVQTITLTYKRNWESTDGDKILTIEVSTGDDGTIESAEAVMMSGAEAAATSADANASSTAITPTGADDTALKDAGSGTDADVATDTSDTNTQPANTSVAETNS